MTDKEKARAYDELIRRLKDFQSRYRFETIKKYFPELEEEESEDEKIRKTICKLLWDNAPYEEAQKYIAWLEKQKAIDVLDEEEREFADNVDSYRKEIDEAYQKGYDEGVKVILEKQGEQKPAVEIKTLEESLGIDSKTYNEIVDECIYGEQKLAWSEEDEKYLKAALFLLKNSRDTYLGIKGSDMFDWLKSIKDRYTWKPSDEQMDALRYVTNFDYGGHKATLVSLYEQLKKLKE